ncbi:MAG: isochorismate synthase [Deltaproteobacteria bacterium]|nr:MAG: isochorismate synthase [Deltaproteobacteria bacterium]
MSAEPMAASIDRAAPCAPSDAAAFIARALDRAAGALVHVTVPAPVAPPEALLAIAPAEPAVLWAPPDGPAFAGVGIAAELDATASRADAAALWRRVATIALSDAPPRPRMFGGMAFAPGAARRGAWAPFGDGRFVLPRWRYAVAGDRAWLTLAGVRPGADAPARAADLLRALARAGDRGRPAASAPRVRRIDALPRELWRAQIDAIRAAIASGAVDKIVAARCTAVDLDAPADAAGVLSRLRARYPDCFRFAFRFDGATFAGASPERLIARDGRHIATQALAGSIDADSRPDAGDALRASSKDQSEHGYVVRAITDALAPLCARLNVSAEPEICTLRHLLHLRTPIRGTLAGPHHVLDLVAALHPTPAVGGVPTADAVQWICAHEPAPRGWYAGPVGWFDSAGDGDFAVALRSGLLAGHRAFLYAGAGIVAASDADAEYAETDLKQRPLLEALGVDA